MSLVNQSTLSSSPIQRGALHFDLPIAQRLMLGFLATAIIAGIVAGAISLQRLQSLHRQSSFYQSLLNTKTQLTVGSNLLELMNNKTHNVLDDLTTLPVISQETLRDDKIALQGLTDRYDQLLHSYVAQDLLENNPDQVALLQESNHDAQVTQQKGLVESALRTWSYYKKAQEQFIGAVNKNDLTSAAAIERLQEERLNDDAQSAMRALIRFNEALSRSVLDAVGIEERYQLVTTVIGITFAFISIALVGLFISNTLVNRLKQLRHITRAVEEGKVDRRLKVVGRDEIADISASVNAMLEIIASEQEIMTAAELKDQFIASVSHELRNPLAGVYGWLEILYEHLGELDNATQANFLDKAINGCQELMHLIDSVLDSTQIGKQVQPPQLVNVAVVDAVHMVIDQFNPYEMASYQLHIDVAPDIVVQADPHYVRQILRNLLSNALKYSPKHSSISIRALNAEQDGAILISVKDTGPGIPPEQAAQLFQKFVRLPRDKAGGIRGTGLGLYICKQLVEVMNGHIWVDSSGRPGEGSCFSFTLPKASHIPNAAYDADGPTPGLSAEAGESNYSLA